jgi:hypothetical protein
MQCDICGEDVQNSEELQTHKERTHPAGVEDSSTDNLERPDHLGETQQESAAREVPKPVH